jgi:hypothetical protein
MAIRNYKEALDAHREGRTWLGFYRRGGPAMAANVWADLSYAAGLPVANYYASTPLTSATLDSGIDLGPAPAAGMSKYISRALIIPPTATGIMSFEFLDICLYYPFVDGDGGYQDLINTVPIPRYGGHECKIMVVSQGVGTADADVLITYTNSDGVGGKQVTATLALANNAGTLCSSFPPGTAKTYPAGPFVTLCSQCKGVRSIQSVEYLSSGGGIQAFVIVKPLFSMTMFEATAAPIEVDFIADRSFKLPQVSHGAYLSAIARGTTAATPATINGQIETIWG